MKSAVLFLLVLCLARPTNAHGQSAAESGCLTPGTSPRRWSDRAVYLLPSIQPRDSAQLKAVNTWCDYLSGRRGRLGDPRAWVAEEPKVGSSVDAGLQWMLQDADLVSRLYVTIDSIAPLTDSLRRRLAVFTRYDVRDGSGSPVTEARTRVTIHFNKDTVVFESAIVNAFRTMTLTRIDGEVHAYFGGIKHDSAKADSGRRFTQSFRRRFNLTFDSSAGPLLYVNAAGEQSLQRLFGYVFLRDTIAGVTLTDAHVILSADTIQREAHIHERVHAALITSDRATFVTRGWEEAIAGYFGGWRGSPWQVNACEQMRMYGREIPSDPAKLLVLDSTVWRSPERVRSASLARNRIRSAAQAAFLSVVEQRGGDAALDSVMFAGAQPGFEQLREIAEKATKLSAAEFSAMWREELVGVGRRCGPLR